MLHVALLVLLAAVAGCEQKEPMGKVFGQVTVAGEPLDGALLVFSNPTRGVFISALVKNGTYELQMAQGYGLPLGQYRVCVSPQLPDMTMGVSRSEYMRTHQATPIPPRYAHVETSGLELEVKAGENRYDIELVP